MFHMIGINALPLPSPQLAIMYPFTVDVVIKTEAAAYHPIKGSDVDQAIEDLRQKINNVKGAQKRTSKIAFVNMDDERDVLLHPDKVLFSGLVHHDLRSSPTWYHSVGPPV